MQWHKGISSQKPYQADFWKKHKVKHKLKINMLKTRNLSQSKTNKVNSFISTLLQIPPSDQMSGFDSQTPAILLYLRMNVCNYVILK